MKNLFLVLLFSPVLALAQSVDVKGLEAGADEGSSTTIEIRKGKAGSAALKNEALWEVHDGTSEVEGDAAAMNKEAKASWKQACNDWKKEFRADNKENKIINMNCGTPTCEGAVGNVTCKSQASYKIKTKIN